MTIRNANGFKLTFDEEIAVRDLALGVWEADDEDDLIEEVTSKQQGGALNPLITKSIKMTNTVPVYDYPKVQSS